MTFQLTVVTPFGGDGTGKVEGPGIACPDDCTQSYPLLTPATQVTLTATATDPSVFVEWGGDCSPQACTVTMDMDRSVTVTFDDPNVTLLASYHRSRR